MKEMAKKGDGLSVSGTNGIHRQLYIFLSSVTLMIIAFVSVPPAPDIFRSQIHSFYVYVAAGSRCSL